MLSDIEIAQGAKMKYINEIAESIGIGYDDIEPYGHYKAKVSEALYSKLADKKDGKLILVTAINPTPAGREKQPLVQDLLKLWDKSVKKLFLHCVNLL